MLLMQQDSLRMLNTTADLSLFFPFLPSANRFCGAPGFSTSFLLRWNISQASWRNVAVMNVREEQKENKTTSGEENIITNSDNTNWNLQSPPSLQCTRQSYSGLHTPPHHSPQHTHTHTHTHTACLNAAVTCTQCSCRCGVYFCPVPGVWELRTISSLSLPLKWFTNTHTHTHTHTHRGTHTHTLVHPCIWPCTITRGHVTSCVFRFCLHVITVTSVNLINWFISLSCRAQIMSPAWTRRDKTIIRGKTQQTRTRTATCRLQTALNKSNIQTFVPEFERKSWRLVIIRFKQPCY